MIFSVLQFFISLPTTSRATLIEKNQKQTKIMHKRFKVTPYWNCWRNLLKNCEDLLSSFLTDPFASQNKDLTKNFFRIFIYFFSNNKSQRIKTWFFFIVFHFTIFVATSQVKVVLIIIYFQIDLIVHITQHWSYKDQTSAARNFTFTVKQKITSKQKGNIYHYIENL